MRLFSPLLWIALILLAVGLYITQPYFLYAGDPNAIRIETKHLLNKKELGIPYENSDQINPAFIPPSAQPDQYFWQNNLRQKYFSRWGLTSTLAYILPMATTGPDSTDSQVAFALNIYNIFLSILICSGLFWLADTSNFRWWPIWCVFGSIGGTFLSYYLRAQSPEIIQILLLVLSIVLFRAINSRLELDADEPAKSKTWPILIALNIVLSLLVHSKVYYSLYDAAALILIFFGRIRDRRYWNFAAFSAIMIGLCVLMQLILNYYKFGDPLEMGIGPAFPRQRSDWYSLDHFRDSIPDYLWGPNGSIPLYFPLITFAFLGIAPHSRRYPRESILIWFNLLAIVLVAGGWINNRGEWCYGPRYLVPALALTIIPALASFHIVAERPWSDWRKIIFALSFLTVVAIGAKINLPATRFDFFAGHQIKGTLAKIDKDTFQSNYFEDINTPKLLADLGRICNGDTTSHLALIDRTLRNINPEIKKAMDDLWTDNCALNFRLWQLPPQG